MIKYKNIYIKININKYIIYLLREDDRANPKFAGITV